MGQLSSLKPVLLQHEPNCTPAMLQMLSMILPPVQILSFICGRYTVRGDSKCKGRYEDAESSSQRTAQRVCS